MYLTVPSIGWHRQPVDVTHTRDRENAVAVIVAARTSKGTK